MTACKASARTALFTLLISPLAMAQHHHDTHGSGTLQSPHVHGTAELLVVLDGDQLELALHSPAINLLGFEHYSNTAEQNVQVERARSALADAENLFQFDPTLCQMTEHTVDFGDVVDTHTANNEVHGHSDIEAHYRYRCERPDELHALSTLISEAFPNVQSLQVQWIAGGRQGATTLDNSHHRILFR